VLAPLVRLLRRLRVGRAPSVLIAVLLAFLVISGISTLIGSQAAELAANLALSAVAVVVAAMFWTWLTAFLPDSVGRSIKPHNVQVRTSRNSAHARSGMYHPEVLHKIRSCMNTHCAHPRYLSDHNPLRSTQRHALEQRLRRELLGR
jgi:hypothetical protein